MEVRKIKYGVEKTGDNYRFLGVPFRKKTEYIESKTVLGGRYQTPPAYREFYVLRGMLFDTLLEVCLDICETKGMDMHQVLTFSHKGVFIRPILSEDDPEFGEYFTNSQRWVLEDVYGEDLEGRRITYTFKSKRDAVKFINSMLSV